MSDMDLSPMLARLRRLGIAAWSLVGAFAVLAILVWLVIQLRIIWPPLIFAVILVYLFKPLVDRLERRNVPRVAGGCLSYLVFGGVLVLAGLLVVPAISDQSNQLVEEFPLLVDRVTGAAVDLARRLDFPIGIEGVESISSNIRDWVADPANRAVILEGIGQVGQIARGVIELLVIVLLAPVLAFYIVVDSPNLKISAEKLIPANDHDEVVHVGRQVAKAVGGFIRGQLVVALIVGVMSSVALLIIDLQFWLIVGLTAGLLNIVPFIGPWVGGALGVSTALIVGDSTKAIWVALAFLAIQQLDNHLISPMVLRVTVRLSPVTIILALLAGGSLGGLLGLLIAVPLTAVLKIVAGHLWRTRVLGESWDEAAEAMMVELEPEPLKDRLRRGSGEHGDKPGSVMAAKIADTAIVEEGDDAPTGAGADAGADADDDLDDQADVTEEQSPA